MKSANRLIAATLAITVLAIGFWVLALGPKRQEAADLSSQVDQTRAALAESQYRLTEALAAKREFPADYRQLVVLGKAVPTSDSTSSLLVELNQVARHSKVTFNSVQLSSSSAGEAAPAPAPAPTAPAPVTPAAGAPSALPAAASVPPTEAAASLLPLGAAIGTAGLGVMPYNLDFSGDFFQVADFINGIDSLVKTGGDVAVDGRLVTLDGFALVPAGEEAGNSDLQASFVVTTYLTPPSQGVTAGATAAAPAPETATPATTTPPSESPESSATPVSEAQ
jgi:Tfp pilus assembly protein PilO